MNLEIGKKIEEVWRATGMSKVAFADKIGMNRNNVYYLFERTNIEAEQLRKIGEVLNHDFFQYYESSNRNIVEEPLVVYAKKELDALNEFDGIISPKEIALSLIRNWMDANKHNPFIAKEDKKQNELNLSAIRFFVQIIDDTQCV